MVLRQKKLFVGITLVLVLVGRGDATCHGQSDNSEAAAGSPTEATAVETPEVAISKAETPEDSAAETVSETKQDEDEPLSPQEQVEEVFRKQVTPFIKTYCIDCHSNRRPTEAGVNFSPALKAPGHAAFSDQWKRAAARAVAHDMPPESADQPTDEERQMFVDWIATIKFLSPQDPGPFVIRRLTKTEYANTLRDLFGVDPAIADSLPDEVSGAGYLNSLSPLQLEQYLAIAERVLDEIWPRDGSFPVDRNERIRWPPVEPDTVSRSDGGAQSDVDSRSVVREFAESLARNAYRRVPSESEIGVLTDVYGLGIEKGLTHSAAVRLMTKSVLVAPQFLFITPAGEVESDAEIVRLDDYQLASRLSYLLWSTMPDDELMSLAEAGELFEPGVLEVQVKRLLDDPRSRALFDGFGAQWLGLTDFDDKVFDPNKFPQMTGELRRAMYDEARLLFETIVRENRSVVEFVDCDYTFLNQTLAPLYGLQDAVGGTEMRRVRLTDVRRGGILSMPGTLAATSFPNRTSAVKRGVWVLEQVLGDHVPSAPPDVPALEEQSEETAAGLTLRERTELHRTNPVCANCHKMLDPIGFGLENYDAIGRWREQDDNGEPIDAGGELPGGIRFSGPVELKKTIAARSDEIARNLVEKLLAYALCRNLEGYDEIVADELMKRVEADGYRMRTLVTSVVTSYPFTHRRIQDERSSGE